MAQKLEFTDGAKVETMKKKDVLTDNGLERLLQLCKDKALEVKGKLKVNEQVVLEAYKEVPNRMKQL